jgi:hypothetical protein
MIDQINHTLETNNHVTTTNLPRSRGAHRGDRPTYHHPYANPIDQYKQAFGTVNQPQSQQARHDETQE